MFNLTKYKIVKVKTNKKKLNTNLNTTSDILYGDFYITLFSDAFHFVEIENTIGYFKHDLNTI